MKLNGWQRIWVIVSILWIAAIVVFYITVKQSEITVKQSESEIYYSWSQELLSYLVSQVDDLKGYSVTSLRSTYSDISDKKLVEVLHKKYLEAHPAYRYGFAEIDAKYEKAVSGDSDNTFNALLSVAILSVAIGVPIALYLLGWAVAWIRRGFKNT